MTHLLAPAVCQAMCNTVYGLRALSNYSKDLKKSTLSVRKLGLKAAK